MDPLSTFEIITRILVQLAPVWISLVLLYALSIAFKRRLGLYGKLYDSPIGMIGFGLVMFWVFTGVYGAMDMICLLNTSDAADENGSVHLAGPRTTHDK